MTSSAGPSFRGSARRLALAVNVYSDVAEVGKLFERGSFVDFCPEYRWTDQPVDGAYELWHIDGSTADPSSCPIDYHLAERRIVVMADPKILVQGETLPYLAYGLLELQGQGIGQATIHGAAISRDGQAILLVGGKGAGKTTLGLELCLNRGFKLIGNDLIILGLDAIGTGLVALGGTKHFNVRLATAQEQFPGLLPCFGSSGSDDNWATRAIIKPDAIRVDIDGDPVPIACVFELHLDHRSSSVKLTEINPIRSRLILYENLSKYIQGTSLPVLVGDDLRLVYRPSFDDPPLHLTRARMITAMVNELNLRHLSGSLGLLADYLDDLLR